MCDPTSTGVGGSQSRAIRTWLRRITNCEEFGIKRSAIRLILSVSILALVTGLAHAGGAVDSVPPAKAAPPDYRLGPEDVVDVFVWKEPDLSSTVVVRPDGKISLPLANELDAGGKTAAELQTEITDKLRQYITQPVVNVMVKEINSLKISVLGEVRKPGVYRIRNRVTVLDAIAMAGGFSDLAKPSKVVVLRNTPDGVQRIKINVKQVVGDDKNAPAYLQSLDTVYVE